MPRVFIAQLDMTCRKRSHNGSTEVSTSKRAKIPLSDIMIIALIGLNMLYIISSTRTFFFRLLATLIRQPQ